MTRKKTSPTPAAAEAWRLMFELLMASSETRTTSLARRNLTPNDSRGLWSLDPENGRPIGDLAREWSCDPSNATFIVSRLEKAGYARREGSKDDGRVKLVFLTEVGAATRAELLREYHDPPAELRALTARDLRELTRILKKVRGTHV
jgi:DNA-binding MarR family transcriptional regulator